MRPSFSRARNGRLTLFVFQVGGDDVLAVAEDALEGHVEGVGAVEGEGEAFRPLAVEELVEEVAAVVEGASAARASCGRRGRGWRGLARESVERPVDGFGFG